MLLNVTEIGSPKVDNGVVSGFSATNYLKITDSFDVSAAQSWEVVYKIKTGTSLSAQSMCGHTGSSNYDPFTIDINSSKFQLGLCKSSSSNLLKDKKGTYTVLVDTTYWLKLTFNGSRYALSYSLDGVDFIEDVVLESTTKIWTSNLVLGRQQGADSEYPFLGSIDLNECYIKINGELWWTGMVEGGIKHVRSYALKRRETKYYKEVVTEGETWTCFIYDFGDKFDNSVWYFYLKNPYNVGDNLYCKEADPANIPNSQEELFKTEDVVTNLNPDGSIEGELTIMGNTGIVTYTPYPSGDLTTTTTELVESTKDDYDVVKIVDSFYSLKRKGEIKYYKEVVIEGESYACFYYSVWGYIYFKKPYSVGDICYNTESLDLAKSVSELTTGILKISAINSNGNIECPFDALGGSNTLTFTPYPSGDLTTTTTELVESTKDDYDVIKEFEGNSYSLCREKK